MKKATLAVVIALVAMFALGSAACGSQTDEAAKSEAVAGAKANDPAKAETSYEFTDKAMFESAISDRFVQLQREQNDVNTEVDSNDCIKSSETTADCIVVAHNADDLSLGTVRSNVTVKCSTSNGENCIIRAEPIN